MYRKIAVAGVTAAAIIGAGTAALAESGSTSGTPSPASSTSSTATSSGSTAAAGAHGAKGSRLGRLARRVVHGQFVTGQAGAFVTHDVIRGQVSSVSPTLRA